MLIGGLQKCSLIDYPEMISAVVFTQGCNLRCPYCHNPALVYPEAYSDPIPENEVLLFLRQRRSLLDGVVISGGEALLQGDLPAFLRRVKTFGYYIKLDTNGSLPDALSAVIRDNLVNFVAMDIKAPFNKYGSAAGTVVDTDAIRESIKIIERSGLNHQFRTTKADALLNDEDIEMIRQYIGKTDKYLVQQINPLFACRST